MSRINMQKCINLVQRFADSVQGLLSVKWAVKRKIYGVRVIIGIKAIGSRRSLLKLEFRIEHEREFLYLRKFLCLLRKERNIHTVRSPSTDDTETFSSDSDTN